MGNISEIYGNEGFDTSSVEPSNGDFQPIPAGWYACEIETAELKTTKAGTGQYLCVGQTIVDEKFSGRKLFTNINLNNPNQTSEEIGMRLFASLGLACGLPSISDSDQLLGNVVEARVKITPAKGEYEAGNDVTAYRIAKGGEGRVATPKASATISAPAQGSNDKAPVNTGTKNRPWEK
jgi:hypothetical protein